MARLLRRVLPIAVIGAVAGCTAPPPEKPIVLRRPSPIPRSAPAFRSRPVTAPAPSPAAEPPPAELTPEQKGALFDEFDRYRRQPAAQP